MHSFFAGSSVSDTFHYAEKFATTDTNKARAEYLKVTGSGRVECDQKLSGKNEVRLNIEIHIQAVTAKFDEIFDKELHAIGQQITEELIWHDVRSLNNY
jgi:hypothetical protein